MKYLKIEDNKVLYSLGESSWTPIDEITKDHLLSLVDCALTSEFEMDVYEKDKIGNQAHQVIYKNIYEKFTDLVKSKDRFKDESEGLYKAAIEKYSQ